MGQDGQRNSLHSLLCTESIFHLSLNPPKHPIQQSNHVFFTRKIQSPQFNLIRAAFDCGLQTWKTSATCLVLLLTPAAPLPPWGLCAGQTGD